MFYISYSIKSVGAFLDIGVFLFTRNYGKFCKPAKFRCRSRMGFDDDDALCPFSPS